MLSAIAVARQSGLLDAITGLLVPLANCIHLPAECCRWSFLRPFSGGGALALLAELLTTYGPDGAIGRAACMIMGSSETLFYCATLYFGSVGGYQMAPYHSGFSVLQLGRRSHSSDFCINDGLYWQGLWYN